MTHGTTFDFVSEHGGWFDGRFLSLNVDRMWDVIPPTEHDKEDGVGRYSSGKEREGHECGERCEVD